MRVKAILLVLFSSLFALAQQVPFQSPGSFPAPSASCAETERRIEQLSTFLGDSVWANRYAEANAKLETTPDDQRVVFFGDSITDIWKLSEYFGNKPYVNRGIGGQTTPQLLIRMKADVLQLKPRVVVILAGTNDIALYQAPGAMDRAKDNLACMSELARANGIKVVLASLLPVHDKSQYKQSPYRPADKIADMNRWIKEYCASTGCVYLDYFSHVEDANGMLRPELSDDGLHPNAAGYKIMAPLAEAAIEQALGKK